MKRFIVPFLLAAGVLFSGCAASQQAPVQTPAARICGAYLCQPNGSDRSTEDYTEYAVEFRYINGQLVAECCRQLDYDSPLSCELVELTPEAPGAFEDPKTESIPVTVRRFDLSADGDAGGQNQTGVLAISGTDLIWTDADGREHLLQRQDGAPALHRLGVLRKQLSALGYPLQEVGAALAGCRTAVVTVGGVQRELYLELDENGEFWYVCRTADEPPALYTGVCAVARTGRGNALCLLAERLGGGAETFSGLWYLLPDNGDGKLLLRQDGESVLSLVSDGPVAFTPGGHGPALPAAGSVPSYSCDGVTLSHDGRSWDVTAYSPLINAILSCDAVGDHVVVTGHINPQTNMYLVFDTVADEFCAELAGCNLIWYGNRIETAVYSFHNEICRYDGSVIGTVEGDSVQDIRSLRFVERNTAVEAAVVHTDGTTVYERFPLS